MYRKRPRNYPYRKYWTRSLGWANNMLPSLYYTHLPQHNKFPSMLGLHKHMSAPCKNMAELRMRSRSNRCTVTRTRIDHHWDYNTYSEGSILSVHMRTHSKFDKMRYNMERREPRSNKYQKYTDIFHTPTPELYHNTDFQDTFPAHIRSRSKQCILAGIEEHRRPVPAPDIECPTDKYIEYILHWEQNQ